MSVGINLMLWTANPSIEEHGTKLEQMKEWGYDTFEVGVGGLDAKQVNAFGAKARELDMIPHCADLYNVEIGNMISADPVERNKAIARIVESIHKTCDMGGQVLSGPIYQGLGAQTDVGATQDEWNWAVDGLGKCANEAEKCNILLAAEPLNRFEMYIVNTIGKAYELCEEISNPHMGILADTHHSNIEESNIIESYVKYVKRIHLVHVSENDRGIPGSGHAVPRELFKCMKAAGYKGDWVIEAFNGNVPELKPLVRVWNSFVPDADTIAIEGLNYIRKNL